MFHTPFLVMKGAKVAELTLDRSEIDRARAAAKAKYEETLNKELNTLLKPRNEAIAALVKANEKLHATLDENQAKLDRLNAEIREITGQPEPTKGKRGRGGAAKRKTPELKAYAEQIVGMIKEGGKKGVAAQDIRRKYPDVGASLNKFLNTYTAYKFKPTGPKKNGIYTMP